MTTLCPVAMLRDMAEAQALALQLLEERGTVSSEMLEAARRDVQEGGDTLVEESVLLDHLIQQGRIDEETVLHVLGEEFAMEVAMSGDLAPTSDALALLDSHQARELRVLPLTLAGSDLIVAVDDPLQMDALDEAGRLTGKFVEPRLTSTRLLDTALDEAYARHDGESGSDTEGAGSEAEAAANAALIDGIEIAGADLAVSEEEGPIIRFVQELMADAIRRRASDIHLEPLEKRFRIRFRIDGVMAEVDNPPKRLQPSILSRLKLMADISIAEKRVAQDGRIQVRAHGKDIDLRVSSLPTQFGESIVMRILDKEGLKLGMPELGFFSDDQAHFEQLIQAPDGIILVTGPTGSGKSTTLYSCLNYINQPDRKLITVEDPVEYQMSGINQVQVRRDVGMSFAAALRAMLRQAPNVIMVGEIRDKETADIAINASLTGHMVFSTLHTNDAPSAVSRLVDLGVKPFLVSAALRAVLAQRLVRRNCRECAAPYEPTGRELAMLGITPAMAAGATFKRGVGCAHCQGRGYRGRMGIFEMFRIDDALQQMIYENVGLGTLRRKARESGMRTLREDGVRKVLAGLTTIEEVLATTVADED